MQNRIIGGLGVLWGLFIMLNAYRVRSHESLDVAQIGSLLLAAMFVIIGLYFVFKGADRTKDPGKGQPRT